MQEDTQKQIDELRASIENIKSNPVLVPHSHNGFDMDKVIFANLATRTELHYFTIYGTDAATAGNYGTFFIARYPCYVSRFQEVHQTAGTDGGAVTLDLEKLTGTTAPDSGVSVLASALSLKATINTVQTATLTNTTANRSLAIGDRLCLKDSGVLTSVANVVVLLEVTYT